MTRVGGRLQVDGLIASQSYHLDGGEDEPESGAYSE